MAKKYYARINGEQVGPIELSDFPAVGVGPDTYIWCKGMSDWTRARHDAEVCRMYRNYLYDAAHGDVASKNYDNESTGRNDEEAEKLPQSFRWLIEKDGTPYEAPKETQDDYSVPPRSRLGEAIVVTLFCSVLGIIAIFYAWGARKAWREGDAEKAYDQTRKAKMWIGISFFLGMIGAVIIIRSLV